jgi:hypothetical protein
MTLLFNATAAPRPPRPAPTMMILKEFGMFFVEGKVGKW